jgi:hypothetical protein
MYGALNACFQTQRLFGLGLGKARSKTDFRVALCPLSKKEFPAADKLEHLRKRMVFSVRINLSAF